VGRRLSSAVLAVFCLLLAVFPAVSREPDGAISLQAGWLGAAARADLGVGPGQEVLRITLHSAVPLAEAELVLSLPADLTAHALRAPLGARFEPLDSGARFRRLGLPLGALAAGSPQAVEVELQASWKEAEAPELLVGGLSAGGRRLEARLRFSDLPAPGADGRRTGAGPGDDGVRRQGAREYPGAPLPESQR
jgi:hypothetical protein